jgi:hypothetical protein
MNSALFLNNHVSFRFLSNIEIDFTVFFAKFYRFSISVRFRKIIQLADTIKTIFSIGERTFFMAGKGNALKSTTTAMGHAFLTLPLTGLT